MIPRVMYFSPYVPAEWIAAHRCIPVRINPNGAPVAAAGVCPFAQACMQKALQPEVADAIVMTTTCDQMRRAAEAVLRDRPTTSFLLNVPATCEDAARQLFAGELHRLAKFLIALGGVAPTSAELIDQMTRYEASRRSLRKPPVLNDPIPIALAGGPVSARDQFIFDLIRSSGGSVVLDASETGSRVLPSFDQARLFADPFAELVRGYLSIPDVFRRPNDELYRYLHAELTASRARAMILVRCVCCDLWHAEFPRLRETFDLPAIEIDLSGDTSERERIRTRIESLLESLR